MWNERYGNVSIAYKMLSASSRMDEFHIEHILIEFRDCWGITHKHSKMTNPRFLSLTCSKSGGEAGRSLNIQNREDSPSHDDRSNITVLHAHWRDKYKHGSERLLVIIPALVGTPSWG